MLSNVSQQWIVTHFLVSGNVPLCRMRYPKELHDVTTIDIETGEIRMRRAHPMLNNFNEWLLMACS